MSSVHRSVLALVATVAIAFAACSSVGSSGAPGGSGLALPSLPSIAVPSIDLQSAAAGLEGFCADFRDKVAATWPNVDASTASSFAPLIQQWANNPELGAVKTDLTTIGTWITAMVAASAVSTPPPDVATAFGNVRTFADTSC